MVKIYTVHTPPNYMAPWTKLTPRNSYASGCIIEGGLVLTNALEIVFN